MSALDGAEPLDHDIERFIPSDGNQLALFAQEGVSGSAGRGKNVMFTQSFGAQLATIHRMLFIAANCDRFAFSNANLHAATNRAVAAGRLDPAVSHA